LNVSAVLYFVNSMCTVFKFITKLDANACASRT